MTPETFFENFDLLADAPNGVPQLRALILQLAVQGKLVPQDPSDEPASVLLERIHEEKARLDGQQKLWAVQDGAGEVDEELYTLPNNWQWIHLDDLVTLMDSGWSPACENNPTHDELTWGVLKTTAVQSLQYKQEEHKKLPDDLTPRPQYEVKEGDLLITRAGPKNRVGICCLVKSTRPKLMISDKIIRFHLVDEFVYPDFIVLCLNIGTSRSFIEQQKSGMAESQMNISQPKLRLTPLPLPPLAEQRRIVAKVDQLMALCDELESRQQQRRAARTHLNDAALDQLLAAREPDEFDAHWHRLRDNFALLYDTPETIGKLRQAVLQLAVQGKLVPQDPDDEPASVLLNKILEERKTWYKKECDIASIENRRKPREPKLESARVSGETKIFNVPETWQFCFFEDIAAGKEHAIKAGPFGSALTKSCYVPKGYKIYGQEQVINDDPFYGDYYIDEEKFLSLRSCEVVPGDILISLVGTIGKVLILPENCEPGIINPRLVKFSLQQEISRRFIEVYLNSPSARATMSSDSHGGTMDILNLKILLNLPIPLPPLVEQRRIVAKVEQLMALCDELEAQLKDAQTRSAALLELVVRQVLADGVTAV